MRQLPVEHGDHALLRMDHEIPVPEIAVHQAEPAFLRQVVEQPLGREVDHRLRGFELQIGRMRFAHGVLRRED